MNSIIKIQLEAGPCYAIFNTSTGSFYQYAYKEKSMAQTMAVQVRPGIGTWVPSRSDVTYSIE